MAKASLLTNIATNIAVRIYNLSTAIVHSLTKFLLLTKLYCTLASCFTLGWNGAARPRDGFRDPGQDPAGWPLRPHPLQEAGTSRHATFAVTTIIY